MYLGSCRFKLPTHEENTDTYIKLLYLALWMIPARLALIAIVGPPDCPIIQFLFFILFSFYCLILTSLDSKKKGLYLLFRII